MKKLSIILCLTMCLLVVGCGSKQESNVVETTGDEVENTENTDDNKETEESDAEEAKQGKDLDGDGYIKADDIYVDEDLANSINDLSDEEIDVIALMNEYDALRTFNDGEKDTERMKKIAKELIEKMPELRQYYDESTGLIKDEAFEVEE